VALIAPILAFLGRFVGKLLQTAFGWATVLLFGRVPESKQLLLSGVALASIAWVAVAIGVLFPDVGAVLLTAMPAPDWIREDWIRLAMLAAAVALPLAIGLGSLFLLEPADRPTGTRRVAQILRGYPYALVLAFVLAFLVVVAPIRKVRSIIKRWEDAHIPVVVKPNGYERVADDIEAALDRAGLPIERAKAPAILETPSRLLAWVGGSSVRPLVPDRILVLKSRGLDVTIYPSDIAMSGTAERVARSRAAMAATLSFTAAYQTVSKEAQEIEDRLEAIATSRLSLPWQALAETDQRLALLVVPYDDWEVLYRIRLQVEVGLRRGSEAAKRHGRDGTGPLGLIGELLRRIIGGSSST
jgi:hypothetical protein